MRGFLRRADRPLCPSLTILHVQSGFWAPVLHTAVSMMRLRTAVSAITRYALQWLARSGRNMREKNLCMMRAGCHDRGHACTDADKGDTMPGSHLLQVCLRREFACRLKGITLSR